MPRKVSTSVQLFSALKKQVEKATNKKGVTVCEYIGYALQCQVCKCYRRYQKACRTWAKDRRLKIDG